MQKFIVALLVVLLALLGSVSALAEDEPQLIFPNPVQPTLNGARVALVKGNFLSGHSDYRPPSACDSV